MIKLLPILCLLLVLVACRKRTEQEIKDREAYKDKFNLPLMENGQYMTIIENPAGSNQIVAYDNKKQSFEARIVNGEIYSFPYLPYPANFGFLPSTFMSPTKGGNGELLQNIVLGAREEIGSYLSVKPVGVVYLRSKGEKLIYILSVPSNKDKNTLRLTEFEDLSSELKNCLSHWLVNYQGINSQEFVGWGDDRRALYEINKWKVQKE